MRIGFSSSFCPDQDLPRLLETARTAGFESLELHWPASRADATWPGLGEPGAARKLLADAGIELACLATELSLHWPDRRTLEEHKSRARHAIDLAGRLGCPFVIVKSGSVPPFRTRDTVLQRIVGNVRELAAHAAEHRVILLVENSGNLAGSRDLWYILDAVGHPSVRGCWSPAHAQAVGDNSTRAVPRIGRSVAVTHVADAAYSSEGGIRQFAPLGEGQVDLAHYLVLMHGIASDARLIVNWPGPGGPARPVEMLGASLAWVKSQLEKIGQAPELSAYKGDKNAPRYAALRA